MKRALTEEAWNLATRRAQEVLELVLKALLNEMSVDSPKTHDPAPVFARAVRARGIEIDVDVLDGLAVLSRELADISALAQPTNPTAGVAVMPPVTVEGRSDPTVDVPAVQAVVGRGSSVMLKGEFDSARGAFPQHVIVQKP